MSKDTEAEFESLIDRDAYGRDSEPTQSLGSVAIAVFTDWEAPCISEKNTRSCLLSAQVTCRYFLVTIDRSPGLSDTRINNSYGRDDLFNYFF